MPAKFKIGEIVRGTNAESEETVQQRYMYWEEGKRCWIYKFKGLSGWWPEYTLSKMRKRK